MSQINIYKFRDTADGKYAFIVASSKEKATEELKKHTSIDFNLIGSKSIEEYNKPIVLRNDILPF